MAAVKSQADVKGSRTEREAGDRVKGYRDQLELLRGALSAVTALREREANLQKRVTELELESVKFLDSDDNEEQESALVTTQRVVESKLSRAREKLHQAEGGLKARMEAVRGEFSRLFLIFKLHRIELEKAELLERMVPGSPILSIEQVVINLRSIVELSRLEVNAQSVEALIPQGERLLEAIQREPDFVVPPAMPTASGAVGSAVAAPAESWCGPWDDGTVDIQAEIKALQAEDPGLKLPAMHERLRKKYPRLYKTAHEVAAMNKPLDGLATGVYEEQKGGGYKLYVTPIGSTITVD